MNHLFDQVNLHTDFVYVDDCDKYLNVSLFYDMITGGMTVNPKNNKSFYIPFEQAPKFGFSTNYVPTDFHPSTNARLLFMVFSDYYHESTEENDYLESRSIRDDFGKNLLTDYTEDEWNNDINFFVQCLVFYLKMTAQGIKIQPPMQNIIKRKLKTDMGANFEDWAYQYFSEDGENLDKNISREEALENFRKFANFPRITMQRFTKALKAFAELCPYIYCLNPPEILNSAGRNMQKVDNKTIEMIHLRTVTQQKMIDDGVALQKAVDRKETEVPFAPVEEKDGEPF